MKNWKKQMKKAASLLLAGVMVLSLVACGGKGSDGKSDKEDKKADKKTEQEGQDFTKDVLKDLAMKDDGTPIKAAITVAELDSEYIIAVQKYMQYILEEAGADVTVSSADGDAENQCNQIYDFIEKGVEVVLIQAADSNAVAPAIKACNDAGVKVIAVNRTIYGDCKVDYSVLIDDKAMGEMCAKYIADNASGKGTKVTTMQGTLGTATADDRAEGFNAGVQANGLDNIRDNPCDWSSETAMAAMNDVLTTDSDVGAVFLHSDCMLAGVVSALTQSDKLKNVGEDGHVMIVSIDGAASALDYIRQDVLDMTVDNSPLAMATIAAKAVLTKVVKGEDLGGNVITVDATAITKDNVDDAAFWGNFNVDDGYWSETASVWEQYTIE